MSYDASKQNGVSNGTSNGHAEYDRPSSQMSKNVEVESNDPPRRHVEEIPTNKCYLCMEKVSDVVVGGLEKFFYKTGHLVGGYPWIVILITMIVVVAFGVGIPFFFTEETAQDKLWVPIDAQTKLDKEWVTDKFPSFLRFNSLIVTAENILTPEVLQAMIEMDTEFKAITDGEYTWEAICARFGTECWSNSILELWSFNQTEINSLTQEDILDTVNTADRSPVYGNDYNVSSVLGNIQYEGEGDSRRIISAEATAMTYFLQSNLSADSGVKDPYAEHWEQGFLDISEEGKPEFQETFYYATRSFVDVGGGAITDDVVYFIVGFMVVIVFVALTLGKFNQVQQRIYVALASVLCVGLSMAVAMGLCSYANVEWGPVHSVLPFLLLGIGVDDSFVIVQSWETLPVEVAHLPVREKIAHMLKHAGVSITVTSLTDILAFGVGATTVLPALKSFCIYCTVGVLATFISQVTFFVACVCIDEQRSKANLNACCCCYKHVDYEPSECSQKSLTQIVFDKYYTPTLLKLPVKIVVFVIAVGFFAFNIYGVTQLKQDFDFRWFLPQNSYPTKYFEASDKYFPADGIQTNIYIGDIDYYKSYDTLEQLHKDASNDPYTYPGSVDSWFFAYRGFLNSTAGGGFPVPDGWLDENYYPTNESNYYFLLNIFMTFGPGARFQKDIVFKDDGKIDASRISLRHRSLSDAYEEIQAMESIQEVAAATGWSRVEHECFAYTAEYLGFESNKVIQSELYRNLGLAFLCVFLMTLVLIANIWTCLLVGLCVIMVLVDVGSIMHFWGLTIDTVTSVNLIIAIGLAVDYSAHIAYMFMTQVGNRNERVQDTMSHIGPAVFQGGFSTFLAFVTLARSNSYVFDTFFRIFLLVVLFGLFHGLCVLPILLSWVGPMPYISVSKAALEKQRQEEEELAKSQKPQLENGVTPSEKYEYNGNVNKAYEADSNNEAVMTTVAL